MKEIIEEIRQFRKDRGWDVFHTPENLAKSIAIEAGELLEHFQWNNDYDKKEVCDELADVLIYCLHMADSLEVDIREIIKSKMIQNGNKYPVEKSKGTSKKYNKL